MEQIELFPKITESTTKRKIENIFYYRTSLIKERTVPYIDTAILSQDVAVRYIKTVIEKKGNSDREQMVVLFLNAKNKIIGTTIAHTGTGNASVVGHKEILRTAILCGAMAIILGHNHPSGDVTPSPEDYAATRHMAWASHLLGIALHDHIIVGEGRSYSFRKDGALGKIEAEIRNDVYKSRRPTLGRSK